MPTSTQSAPAMTIVVLVLRVAPQLEREPEHRQALARPLRVPHDAAAIRGLLRLAGAPNGLVDGGELLVPAELAEDLAAVPVALEDDEALHQVEQSLGREHALEEHLLGARRSAVRLREVGLARRPERLPLRVEAVRGRDRAIDGGLPARGDEDCTGSEGAWGRRGRGTGFELLVPAELMMASAFHPSPASALSTRSPASGMFVDEDHEVGPDVLLRALDRELLSQEKL